MKSYGNHGNIIFRIIVPCGSNNIYKICIRNHGGRKGMKKSDTVLKPRNF